MPEQFVHLHVASGYSLRYGTTHPHLLVERAAEFEMDALALTDRDGVYGAVRFANACRAAGIRPILGVDLAVYSAPRTTAHQPVGREFRFPTPAKGGRVKDPAFPRVTFLAGSKAGWGALCRLISAAHANSTAEREQPTVSPELVAEYLNEAEVLVMLGPDSDLGRQVARHRDDLAADTLRRWRNLVADRLVVELVSHRLPGSGPGSLSHAARMAGLAQQHAVPTVLSNAVRHLDRTDAPVADILDATRRLVPLAVRHLDRGNAEGYLKSGQQMQMIADDICRGAGLGQSSAAKLLADTRLTAERCVLDPRVDLGIGEVHFPDFEVAGRRASTTEAQVVLRHRCESAIPSRYGDSARQRIWKRLDDELQTIDSLGYASYFLAVSEITGLIRELGIRSAARGSGAGSLVNYLLGVSGVDPIRHGLLMERFLSPLRTCLPDIDIDVESARRLEVYDAIMARFGPQRCAMVSMMDTYKVRHAIRDVGAALGMPIGEIDALAKAFPHVRARDASSAIRDLPELRDLRSSRRMLLGETGSLELFFSLVESLDGLPRHIAMHPCGVLLSDTSLLDRTPVEASSMGYPMSQFDKDDVEELGLLKLDVLGIRMQSAMAHAVELIEKVDGVRVDLDDPEQVPFTDPTTYKLISSAKTLGIFQIESPGQRELVGKSGIDDFEDVIADISLFRPGPVKSDMIRPYLDAKQGWRLPTYLHEDLRPILSSTHGVVVYHEQVIEIIAQFTGCSFAEGDQARRALGNFEEMAKTRSWFFARSLERGYSVRLIEQIWEVLEAFGSFGFCKAHAAAFALPTFQSAWLKAHWPAHFLAGVLTHDPGMYPKRLLLDDARQLGILVLPLDINASEKAYAVEKTNHGYGIRLALEEVKGISSGEIDQILASRRSGSPFASLSDFWQRATISRPVVESLVLAGAFDQVHCIGEEHTRRRTQLTRRDLLLQVNDLEHLRRADKRAGIKRARGLPKNSGEIQSYQLTLDIGADQQLSVGLPEMSAMERVRAELEVLGLDASRHVVDFYAEFLDLLGVTRSEQLLQTRNRAEVLVAGVKVATQTPPVRSGRRVIFLTLDDATGPVDATFFESVQGDCAATVFGSWLLLVRGTLRRTGKRGVSVLASQVWDLGELHSLWQAQGLAVVWARLEDAPVASAEPTGPRRVLVHSSGYRVSPYADLRPAGASPEAVAAQASRKLWHRSQGSSG